MAIISDDRVKEIALAYVVHQLKKDGVTLDPERLGRELGNQAKALGFSKEEILDTYERLVRELVDEVFATLRKK